MGATRWKKNRVRFMAYTDVDGHKVVDADQFEDSDPNDSAKDIPPSNLTQSGTAHVPHPPPVVLGSPQRPFGNNMSDQSVDQQGRSSDWFIVHSLRRSAIIDGKRHYQVKWKGYNKMTWEPEENIPDELIQDFHIRKTQRSKAHKRRRWALSSGSLLLLMSVISIVLC